MITEFFITLAAQVWGWFGTLFPEWEDEAALDAFPDLLATAMGWFVGLGVWVPWPVISACVVLQLSVTGIVFLIKGVRAVASHIPLFGGHGA